MSTFNIYRADWMDDGICRDHPDINFVPDTNATAKLAIAKAICVGCPVAATCLDHALEWGEVGVWGGTDDKQRKAMRKAASRTLAAYQRNEAAA